jgi:hypothetical protein
VLDELLQKSEELRPVMLRGKHILSEGRDDTVDKICLRIRDLGMMKILGMRKNYSPSDGDSHDLGALADQKADKRILEIRAVCSGALREMAVDSESWRTS